MVERWTVEVNPNSIGHWFDSGQRDSTRVPERSNGRGLRSRASASWVRIPPRVKPIKMFIPHFNSDLIQCTTIF